jgi:hypothetical protein
MIRHSGSSLTYIRPEVWLLFFHFSITAVFYQRPEKCPPMFLPKESQTSKMHAATFPRFGTRDEDIGKSCGEEFVVVHQSKHHTKTTDFSQN